MPLRWCIFSLSMVLKLMEKVQAKGHVPSVIAAPAYYLLHIVREGITFLACARSEMSPLLGIEVSLLNFYSMLLLPSCLHSFSRLICLVIKWDGSTVLPYHKAVHSFSLSFILFLLLPVD